MDPDCKKTTTPVGSGEKEMTGRPEPDLRPGQLPCRLLVIDDAPFHRETLAYMLRTQGFLVTEAAGGQEGLRRLRETPVDLVLTDLQMPDLSGWEVARWVRYLRPGLPIVLITGSPEVTDAPSDLRALVSAILSKPFTIERLLEIVRGLIVSPRGAPNIG